MKTPLEMWIDRLTEEAATVQIVGAHHAPGTPYHGSLIGVTSDGATLPFWGCRTIQQAEAELEDRRQRYAYKSAKP